MSTVLHSFIKLDVCKSTMLSHHCKHFKFMQIYFKIGNPCCAFDANAGKCLQMPTNAMQKLAKA